VIRRYEVYQDFFSNAEQLRRCFDDHFDNPYEQSEPTHGVWNYWYVPEMYNYLRADPQRIFGDQLAGFMRHVRAWARATLGLTSVSRCSLHLYVNGCGQGLHSDFHNGIWGYVFSLTRWHTRTFKGGETLIFHDGVPNYKRHHVQGDALYELVPARFNQLLVFDDRIVHAVRPLQGTMDPREGRVVLNGHLFGGFPVVDGPLDPDGVRVAVWQGLPALAKQIAGFKDVQGMISVRFEVSTDGLPGTSSILFNNLVSSQNTPRSVEATTAAILDYLGRVRFGSAASPSTISVPILVPIPPLRTLRLDIPHSLGREQARARTGETLAIMCFSGEGLDGDWDGDRFAVIAPGAGVIEVDDTRVHAEIDLPMMNPSQSSALETNLDARLREGLSP
jgi:hypothetical protein